VSDEPQPEDRLRDAWLVAAWPGLGGVALIAAWALVRALGAEQSAQLPGDGHYELHNIDVEHGILQTPRLPTGVFFEWRRPGGEGPGEEGPDILLYLAEAQPQTGADKLAREVIKRARARGVRRVATFAALARPMHPRDDVAVHAVATDREMLDRALAAGAEPLAEGQVGGLNGVALGVGEWEGLPGLGLMADIPYFAGGAPNPKSAKAALEVFARVANLDLDLDELGEQAASMEDQLSDLLERLQQAAREGRTSESVELPQPEAGDEPGEESTEEPENPRELTQRDRARIEELFDAARGDRSRAVELKTELDRLGVFGRYEDRFLDLFKRAE